MNVLPLQQGLKAKGFDPGPLDGVNGPRTMQAAAEFMTNGAAPDGVGAALMSFLLLGGLTSRLRLIHFLAQVAHESAFKPREEGLNYSAQRLAEVWPSRYAVDPRSKVKEPTSFAKSIAGQPEKIANATYANRMGNGSPESGDGWAFRGRGWLQITGRSNYRLLGFESRPDVLLTLAGSAEAAAMFWHKNGLNLLADEDDTVAVTQRINGGNVGYADRKAKTDALKAIWSA